MPGLDALKSSLFLTTFFAWLCVGPFLYGLHECHRKQLVSLLTSGQIFPGFSNPEIILSGRYGLHIDGVTRAHNLVFVLYPTHSQVLCKCKRDHHYY